MEITKRPASDFTRVFDIIRYQKEKYANVNALNSFEQGKWRNYSIQQIQQCSDFISSWFIDNGFVKGEKIALVPVIGRPEWMMIDFACQQIGLVVVPIHPTSRTEEIQQIFRETETRICITADDVLLEKFASVSEQVVYYHIMTGADRIFPALKFSTLTAGQIRLVNALKYDVHENDVFTILYTSGSSGIPKGVMLTHQNVIHNIKAVLTLLPLDPGDCVISFLPFSHIFERMTCYTYLAFGASLYFSHNKESFAKDFKTIRPRFCTTVPRVLEKMYDFLEEQLLDKSLIKRKIVTWALGVGKEYKTKSKINFLFTARLFLARLFVLNRWRSKLGGKLKYMVVGAASLRPEIGRLFSSAGILIVEGYGLTETSPLITMNRFEPGMNHFGTVGMTISGIEVRIDEPDENQEGEILVKGPNVTQGYFKQPAFTQEAFTADGWFRTGDVGKFVSGRFLRITDRKKEIFKTSSGKYIAPQPLQNHFCKSIFIERCLIIGFQRPYVTALLVPQMEVLESWCRQEDIHWTSPQFMVHNIKVRAKIEDEVNQLNESLPNVEHVRNFVLCHDDWSIERGELTPTMKPVRRVLEKNYENEINKMYI